MKKLITLLLATAGMVSTVSAWTTVKLLNNVEGKWDTTASTEMTKIDDGTHNFFYYILDSSTVTDAEGNYYFRIYVTDDGGKYYGAKDNDFAILDYTNYGGTEGSYSFKLVTDKTSKYIISVGFWDNVWHFTATTYSGTGTITFVNTSNFSTPKAYVYCTGEARLTGGWPGTAMTLNADGTYSLSNVNIGKNTKVIISDNGSNQISDQDFSNDLVLDGSGPAADQTFEVGSLGYATFSSAYPLNILGSEAVKAYRATVTDGKVVLHQVTGSIPAKTGLVLAGTAYATATISPATGVTSIDDNLLKASVTATQLTYAEGAPYRYFLAGSDAESVGFYYLASNQNSAAGKAYLETSTALANTTADARVAWTFADEVTGITSSYRETLNDTRYYDLQGRCIAQPTKGLYIINGKKIIF
mgnify:CR=1 FL=1